MSEGKGQEQAAVAEAPVESSSRDHKAMEGLHTLFDELDLAWDVWRLSRDRCLALPRISKTSIIARMDGVFGLSWSFAFREINPDTLACTISYPGGSREGIVDYGELVYSNVMSRHYDLALSRAAACLGVGAYLRDGANADDLWFPVVKQKDSSCLCPVGVSDDRGWLGWCHPSLSGGKQENKRADPTKDLMSQIKKQRKRFGLEKEDVVDIVRDMGFDHPADMPADQVEILLQRMEGEAFPAGFDKNPPKESPPKTRTVKKGYKAKTKGAPGPPEINDDGYPDDWDNVQAGGGKKPPKVPAHLPTETAVYP